MLSNLKTLLAILVCVSACAQSLRNPAFVARLTSTSASNNTTDWNKGFESGITDMAETDASSKLDPATTANYHSGSKAMSVTLDADGIVSAYLRRDFGAVKSALSLSFWHYASESTNSSPTLLISQIGASLGTQNIRIYYKKASGTYGYTFRGTAESSKYNVTVNNWYRIEVVYVQNGSSTMTVYDAAGNVAVATITVTAGNNNCQYLYIGSLSDNSTYRWSPMYFDDIGVDFTDSTSPLWPFELTN